MDLDAGTVGAWLGRWWTEAALGVIALVGVVTGVRDGAPVPVVVAAALATAVVDRVRLRMDNRSLAVAVTEVRDAGVSAARREAGTAAEGTEADADGGREARADPDGTDAGSDRPDADDAIRTTDEE